MMKTVTLEMMTVMMHEMNFSSYSFAYISSLNSVNLLFCVHYH